jgi:hypothetical protein
MKETIKEKIIELNFYLIEAITTDNRLKVLRIREQISKLIDEYLSVEI